MSDLATTPMTAQQRHLLTTIAAHATELASLAGQYVGGDVAVVRGEVRVLQALADTTDERLTDLLWTVDR